VNWSTELFLNIHIFAVSAVLALMATFLLRRGLYHWTSAGFWAWWAFGLYFVITPLATLMNAASLYEFQTKMEIAGGIDRGWWILTMIVAGITAFFIVYLRTPYKPVTWQLPAGIVHWKLSALLSLCTFMVFGIYSLVVFRAGLGQVRDDISVVNGRFVGNITGYQIIGYLFLFVPIILLMLARKRRINILGWIAASGFVILSLPNAWSRFATVSFILALSMVEVVRKSRRWPKIYWIVAIPLIMVVFQIRGHAQWQYSKVNVIVEINQIILEIPEKFRQIFSSGDTSMLQTWYVESYFYDTWIGYDYGLPVLNYVMTGWIPTRFLPDKYFLIDWLNDQRGTAYPVYLDRLLSGAKSSLLGSFYIHGGLLAVLIGAGLTGFLSRRLDGMLAKETSPLVKGVAIAWLSVLWMIWGSHDFWGIMVLGGISMPVLATWLFLKKGEIKKKQYLATRPVSQNTGRYPYYH
jgi:hypothetical protein